MRHGTIETPAFNNTNPNNLLINGDFKHWTAGDNVAPDNWVLAGIDVTIAKETSIVKLGLNSVKITRADWDCALYQNIHEARGLEYWKGRAITYGCWVYATEADRVCLSIYDGNTLTYSPYHIGDSTWQWLTVTKIIPNDASLIGADCLVINGNTSAYFSGAIAVEGTSAFAYSDQVIPEAQNGEVNPTNVVPDYIGQIYVNTTPTTGSRGIFVAYGLGVGEWVDITIVVYGPDVTDPAFASASSYL